MGQHGAEQSHLQTGRDGEEQSCSTVKHVFSTSRAHTPCHKAHPGTPSCAIPHQKCTSLRRDSTQSKLLFTYRRAVPQQGTACSPGALNPQTAPAHGCDPPASLCAPALICLQSPVSLLSTPKQHRLQNHHLPRQQLRVFVPTWGCRGAASFL